MTAGACRQNSVGGLMYFKQFYLQCLAHASYMIADEKSALAVVVDPQRDIDVYMEEAGARGFRIEHVFLTHFHADFISGHLELKERTGATIHLGAGASPQYPHEACADGSSFDFGSVRLTVLATPGHTPESISILVYDLSSPSPAPYAVLTGDTLFIGDVGRPDLMASAGIAAEELASQLYDSLNDKILRLPDETLVYPAHGAGSFCGKSLGKETVSTIGAQRKLNYALQPMSREAFVRLVCADQPPAPGYFSYDASLNKKERPTLDQSLSRGLKPLDLAAVLDCGRRGAYILDTREPTEFAACHLPASINIGLSGQFATWAGTVLEPGRQCVIIAEKGREKEAALRLGRIGFDCLAGYLEGGTDALAARPDLTTAARRVTADELAEMLSGEAPPLVLDVRADSERDRAHIPGSMHIPLPQLASRLDEIPRERKLVVHCAGGYRSSIAASILRLNGFSEVPDLIGGMSAWEKHRQVKEPTCTA